MQCSSHGFASDCVALNSQKNSNKSMHAKRGSAMRRHPYLRSAKALLARRGKVLSMDSNETVGYVRSSMARLKCSAQVFFKDSGGGTKVHVGIHQKLLDGCFFYSHESIEPVAVEWIGHKAQLAPNRRNRRILSHPLQFAC